MSCSDASNGGGVNGSAPAPCGAVVLCLAITLLYATSAASGAVRASIANRGKAATWPARKARPVIVFIMGKAEPMVYGVTRGARRKIRAAKARKYPSTMIYGLFEAC